MRVFLEGRTRGREGVKQTNVHAGATHDAVLDPSGLIPAPSTASAGPSTGVRLTARIRMPGCSRGRAALPRQLAGISIIRGDSSVLPASTSPSVGGASGCRLTRTEKEDAAALILADAVDFHTGQNRGEYESGASE